MGNRKEGWVIYETGALRLKKKEIKSRGERGLLGEVVAHWFGDYCGGLHSEVGRPIITGTVGASSQGFPALLL